MISSVDLAPEATFDRVPRDIEILYNYINFQSTDHRLQNENKCVNENTKELCI